jgi:O-antigen ligase
MNATLTASQSDAQRERAIILVCAFAAFACGTFAALGAEQAVGTILVACVFGVAAFVLPLSWVALVLAALIPLQVYFPFAGALNLRGALVFVAVAALRVGVIRFVQRGWWSALRGLRSLPWIIPAAFFIFAALVAAVTAFNRYEALKGIYLWLPIFATAFVIGEIVHSERLAKQIIVVLIGGGVGEAILGLIQTGLDVPRVVSVLQLPISSLVYQPNLLRDRLADLSFNWIFNERVLSFGTFINNIDYAIFLAAILALVLALLLGEEQTTTDHRPPTANRYLSALILFICAILLGAALLQTIKGSGVLALAGGIGAIALLYAPRLSPRLVAIGAFGCVAALLFAAMFYGDIAARVLFLTQREEGAISVAGRVTTWIQLLGFLSERPLFGFGLNNTTWLLDWVPSLSGGAFVLNTATPESAYIAALVETGVVGFGALMLFIIVVVARAYRNAQAARAPAFDIGLGVAVVAILCGSLTVVGLTTDQNGMLLGALIGLIFSSPDSQ